MSSYLSDLGQTLGDVFVVDWLGSTFNLHGGYGTVAVLIERNCRSKRGSRKKNGKETHVELRLDVEGG